MPWWVSPSTRSPSSAREPSDSSASSTPWRASQSSMKLRNGRPASGITGFGVVRVSGLSLVPSPPARTTASIGRPLAADALVRVAGARHELAVEEVAPVHDERLLELLLHLARPVELAELGPLGHEHHRIGAVDRLHGGARDRRAAEEIGGAAG